MPVWTAATPDKTAGNSARMLRSIQSMHHVPKIPPIFIVDDSPDDLFFTRTLLTKARVENPVVCFDGAEVAMNFLECAVAGKGTMPLAVFTDLKMHRVNGLEFLRWIRGRDCLSNLFVAMLTGSGEPRDHTAAEALKVNAYLVKYPPAQVIADVVHSARVKIPPVTT